MAVSTLASKSKWQFAGDALHSLRRKTEKRTARRSNNVSVIVSASADPLQPSERQQRRGNGNGNGDSCGWERVVVEKLRGLAAASVACAAAVAVGVTSPNAALAAAPHNNNNAMPDIAYVSSTASKQQRLTPSEQATVDLFRERTPSVVYVTNLQTRRDAFTLDIMEVPQGTGSGFVWDDDNHIVTNFHVIRGANEVKVSIMGEPEPFSATVVGFDQDKDVAVLKVDAPPSLLNPIPIGQSSNLLVGQNVLAIGNPFGLDHTLTTGVISGTGREIASGITGRPIQDIVQTDAAINPGNSGGPLLNSSGYLIGINTAIYSPSGASSGVGFAIPVDTVKGIVDQLIKFGRVTRPFLGISFAPDNAAGSLGIQGVLVLETTQGGPAQRAGLMNTRRDDYGRLRLGDVVQGIDDQVIKGSADLYKILDRCEVGQTIDLKLLRGDEQLTVPLKLEPNP